MQRVMYRFSYVWKALNSVRLWNLLLLFNWLNDTSLWFTCNCCTTTDDTLDTDLRNTIWNLLSIAFFQMCWNGLSIIFCDSIFSTKSKCCQCSLKFGVRFVFYIQDLYKLYSAQSHCCVIFFIFFVLWLLFLCWFFFFLIGLNAKKQFPSDKLIANQRLFTVLHINELNI